MLVSLYLFTDGKYVTIQCPRFAFTKFNKVQDQIKTRIVVAAIFQVVMPYLPSKSTFEKFSPPLQQGIFKKLNNQNSLY